LGAANLKKKQYLMIEPKLSSFARIFLASALWITAMEKVSYRFSRRKDK
jgi:hypothetical protein